MTMKIKIRDSYETYAPKEVNEHPQARQQEQRTEPSKTEPIPPPPGTPGPTNNPPTLKK